jgi:hypothetical protein
MKIQSSLKAPYFLEGAKKEKVFPKFQIHCGDFFSLQILGDFLAS